VKLLLDTCVWGKAREELLDAGHDVVWAGDWVEDPGDTEMLDRAYRESRSLVTLDKDFGTLAILAGQPHSGILRLVGISAKAQAGMVLLVLERHAEELRQGALVTVGPGYIRIRPAD